MLDEYQGVLWWTFAISLALFLLTPLAVAWLLVRLPADYFAAKTRHRTTQKMAAMPRLALLAAKNVLGAVLVVAGLVMLVVPGQGLLTIAAGLMLLDFPGKFRLERWFATRPQVWRSINWVRRRAGKPELKRPENQTA